MKWIIALSSVLGLAGCASGPEYVKSDFTYQDISDYGSVGVRASSRLSGKSFEVYGICDEDERSYLIRQTSTALYGVDKHEWGVNIGGGRFWTSDMKFNEASYIAALPTLEVVRPTLGGDRRMKVAGAQMEGIPSLCEERYRQIHAAAKDIKSKSESEDGALIRTVVDRTGVQPMLSGKNQVDFNNLIMLIQKNGIAAYLHKFIWAKDGDYIVTQALNGRVILESMTNPWLFPAITIITEKEALEGQFWSSASNGPLELVGVEKYQTALGAKRQTVVLKTL